MDTIPVSNNKNRFRLIFSIILILLLVLGIWYVILDRSSDVQNSEHVQNLVSASKIYQTCEAKPQPSEIFGCYEQYFSENMKASDATKTLVLLDEIQKMGGYAEINCHPLSHKIGNIALNVYGSVIAGSKYYLPVCYSGYYHGLLEEFLATAPDYKTGIVTACGKLEDKVYFDWFQCTHGLGHGVMQYREDDVLMSVKDCDLLGESNFAQKICYGGVFMENITTDAKTGHPSKYIKAEDPIYPCNIVDTRYKDSCYFLSSSMILRLNNYNFLEGIKTCDKSEKPYVYLCYQSMGRDISGTYQRDIAKVNELCVLGNPSYIGDCYFGAVRDFINEKGKFDTALNMCLATPNTYKAKCYDGVIYDLGLYKRGQEYIDVCNLMEVNFRESCINEKKV